jgi:hypothetical protein
VTGFIVETVDKAVLAVGRIGQLSRAGCRQEFERRFDVRRMAQDYVRIYRARCGADQDPRKFRS